MSRMDEREMFSKSYAGTDPEALWPAVKRALATMGLKDADDTQRTAQFSTGFSAWSWGENMLVSVVPGEADAARLVVSGRPKSSFLTTKWGEDLHSRGVEKELLKGIDAALEEGSAEPRTTP